MNQITFRKQVITLPQPHTQILLDEEFWDANLYNKIYKKLKEQEWLRHPILLSGNEPAKYQQIVRILIDRIQRDEQEKMEFWMQTNNGLPIHESILRRLSGMIIKIGPISDYKKRLLSIGNIMKALETDTRLIAHADLTDPDINWRHIVKTLHAFFAGTRVLILIQAPKEICEDLADDVEPLNALLI